MVSLSLIISFETWSIDVDEQPEAAQGILGVTMGHSNVFAGFFSLYSSLTASYSTAFLAFFSASSTYLAAYFLTSSTSLVLSSTSFATFLAIFFDSFFLTFCF